VSSSPPDHTRPRRPSPDLRVLVTCEHAGNRVPEAYRSLFQGRGELLESHRGWDPGSLPLARHLARVCDAPLRFTTVTRLLVDPNRSELTRHLPEEERRRIMARHHRPYWSRVRGLIREWLDDGAGVLHLGVHSFTPTLDGTPRTVDVGVLYDPDREGEARFASRLVGALESCLPRLRIGHNVPYHGTSNGLTSALRRHFGDPGYLGIELEVSQGITTAAEPERVTFFQGMGQALTEALGALGREGARPVTPKE
jgi:predicted N-formylglutamate amidohydrolase